MHSVSHCCTGNTEQQRGENKERKRDRETGIAISPGEKCVVFDSELISTVDFPCMITDCKIKSLDLVKIYEL